MRKKLLLQLAAATLVTLPMVVQADPPWKRDQSEHNNYRDEGRVEVRVGYGSDDCDRGCNEGEHSGGPPPWAPAHGYRRKHKHKHEREEQYARAEQEPQGNVQVRYSDEFDISKGTCNREEIGMVLGGVVGGVIGNRVGKNNDNEAVGTIAGAVVGILVGRTIGRKMDRADQQCTGQVLERAADGQTVQWRNSETGLAYNVTPTRTFRENDRYCREYITQARSGSTNEQLQGKACRNADGSWQLANGGTRM